MEMLPIEISLPYDSKRDTGFVGILEETEGKAYVNSLLQILFHIPKLRMAVLNIPTVNPTSSIGKIQTLFYNLQESTSGVSRPGMKMFTSSFHDELTTLLVELDQSLKGTSEEGKILKLFEGHYCEHDNANFKRTQSFSSLSLEVENCKDVYASFEKYLEGNNNYHGAKRCKLFTELPPILQLHLSRFQYEKDQNPTVKVNSRYEYPYQLDLDRDNGKYFSPDADRRIPNLYTLHSVLVHSGKVDDGKYFALINPTLAANFWLKLEDHLVNRVDIKRALDEQFGGEYEHPPYNFTKGKNAVFLNYIRECDKESIMCNKNDITDYVRLEKKGEEKDAIIKIAVEERRITSFRIKKNFSFTQLEASVADFYGVTRHRLRFYTSPSDSSTLLRSKQKSAQEVLGDRDEMLLFLSFNVQPGFTGVCELCPVRSELEIMEMEDFDIWKSKPTGQPSKSSARVTKRNQTKHV